MTLVLDVPFTIVLAPARRSRRLIRLRAFAPHRTRRRCRLHRASFAHAFTRSGEPLSRSFASPSPVRISAPLAGAQTTPLSDRSIVSFPGARHRSRENQRAATRDASDFIRFRRARPSMSAASASAPALPSLAPSVAGGSTHEKTMGTTNVWARARPTSALAIAIAYSIAWAVMSSGLIFLNNYLLRERGFEYPMMLCSMGVTSSWAISFALVKMGRVALKHEGLITRRWYVRQIAPIGFLGALSLGFGNYAYLYLSVSFIQMLKAAVPAVTLVVMFSAGLEKLHRTTLTGVVIVTLGTLIATYGEVKFSLIGLMMMMLSEVCEALRMAFYQYLLGNLKFDMIEGLYVMGPASLAFLWVGIAIFELGDFIRDGGVYIMLGAPFHFLCAALMGFCVNYLSLAVVAAMGGVGFKVMGQAKNAAVILGAMLIFRNPVTGIQVVGYLTSIVGFFVYQNGKLEIEAAARRSSGKA